MSRRGWGVTLLLVAIAGGPALAGQKPPFPAPAIELPDATGTAHTLASLAGQVVLVDVWASWCVPCRVAFPHYEEFLSAYRPRGFQVVGINVDETRADADRFLQGRPYEMLVLFDPKGVAPKRLGVAAMPTSYLVDRHGTVRYRHEGFSERDVAAYRQRIEALLAEAP